MKKNLALLLVICLICGILPCQGAVETQTISVRASGLNGDLIPSTQVSMELFDLAQYGLENSNQFTALHGLIKALLLNGFDPKNPEILELGNNGAYVIRICGLTREKNGGFMFTVNNVSGYLSIFEQELKAGDSLVFYYVEDFSTNIYSYFDHEELVAEGGETISLQLSGLVFDNTIGEWGDFVVKPIDSATILIGGAETQYKTDQNGLVSLRIPKKGNYILSAKKLSEGKNILKAAYCRVAVLSDQDTEEELPDAPVLSGITLKSPSFFYELKNSTSVAEGTLFQNEGEVLGEQGFNQNVKNYITVVNYFVEKILIIPTTSSTDAYIEVNEERISSSQSVEIPLSFDCENLVSIKVSLEENGPSTEYSLKIVRLPNVSLKNIQLENGHVENLSFQPGKTQIEAQISETQTSDQLTLEATEGCEIYYGVPEYPKSSEELTGGTKVDSGVPFPVEFQEGTKKDIYISSTVNDKWVVTKYTLTFHKKATYSPSSVLEFSPAPGQYTNTESFGIYADKTLRGEINSDYITNILSLGAFGGSITYQYETPIKNDENHPYGVDFIVYGNSYKGNEEPGGVLVAQDKDGDSKPDKWYTLAGSEHYEEETIWDYSVTYHQEEKNYPNVDIYESANENELQFSGTLIQNRAPQFGYADVHPNGKASFDIASNPYQKDPYLNSKGDGFDLSWAVDEKGLPVSLDEISFIKIYTCAQFDSSSLGELSTEIGGVARVQNSADNVSKELESIEILEGEKSTTIPLESGKTVYEITLSGYEMAFRLKGSHENILINNQRVQSGEKSQVFTVFGEKEKPIRMIVQDGTGTPAVYYFKITAPQVDANGLQNKINEAKALNKSKYTSSSYSRLEKAINEAESLLQIGESTTLLLKSAYQNLCDGIENLVLQSNGGGQQPTTKTVRVTVKGDQKKGTILSSTKVIVESSAKAFDAIEKVLLQKKIDFDVSGSGNSVYIAGVDGLSEYDNGEYSGWLYKINNKLAEVSMADCSVNEGDSILLFYTDDWTKEEDTIVDSKTGSSNIKNPVSIANNGETVVQEKVFQDVSGMYEQEINFLYSRKIILGKTTTNFYPKDGITRAELITLLSRIQNEDIVIQEETEFKDVSPQEWYFKPISWASKNKLILGFDGLFYPEEIISKEDLAMILIRYLDNKVRIAMPKVNDKKDFEDHLQISDYAKAAVSRLWQSNFLGSIEKQYFPKKNATREEAAVMISRMLKGMDI